MVLPTGEVVVELPIEIDFRKVEAAALTHVEAGLLELQSLGAARAESHFSAATSLVEWSHELKAERSRARLRLLAKLRRPQGSTEEPDPALWDELNRAMLIELKIDPREFYVALAAATLAVGFPETALPFAEKAKAAAPLDAEALLLSACVKESLALGENVRAHERKARRLREEAEVLFREALAADPPQVEARLRLGRVLLKESRPHEANPSFNRLPSRGGTTSNVTWRSCSSAERRSCRRTRTAPPRSTAAHSKPGPTARPHASRSLAASKPLRGLPRLTLS